MKSLNNWVKHKFLIFIRNPAFGYLAIFVIAFGVFFYIQYTPAFPDPDSFYHLKMALLIRDGNLAQNFPWLSDFTVLGKAYADQHFLYHVFLIPFISIFDPAIGIKIATIFLASLLVVAFYWFLKENKISFAWFYSILLLIVEPFTFRISLAKAPSVSIIFFLIILWCVYKSRTKLLFFVSAIYVWAYGGFLLALVAVSIFWVVRLVFRLIERKSSVLQKQFLVHQKTWWQEIFQGKEGKFCLAALGGIILGLVINPYFPQNLSYYWIQLVKIGIMNYQKIIGVGGEWYPYGFTNLVPNAVFLFLLLAIALVAFFITLSKQDRFSFTQLILAIFFFILTLKSRRYVEYFVPFGMLFCAFAINPLLKNFDFKTFIKRIPTLYFSKKIVFTILTIYFLVMIPTIILRDFRAERESFLAGIPYNKFQRASLWLIKNTPENSVVLHSDWDEFPILFYHNTHNHYIAGLDPTFMYLYNQDLYWKWVHITTGEEKTGLYDIIKNDFKGATVFLEKDHIAMDNNFKKDIHFKLVYEDNEAKIYQIKDKL